MIVQHRGIVNFLGVFLDAIEYCEVFQLVDYWIADKTGRSHHIACINAYCVTLAKNDRRLQRIYNGSDIAGADGMPFTRWIQRVKKYKSDRLAAPDIVLELAKRSKVKGYTFYLYGGAPDVVENMKNFLEFEYPHIDIVGYYSPPFRELTQAEDDAICHEINRLQPDVVCVGLGTPKQDYWIDDHLERIKGSVLIASGATFDFFGGRIRMAPPWIRNSGFEWLYRLISKDFHRLWRRYTLHNINFVFSFIRQLIVPTQKIVDDQGRWLRD